MAKYLDYEGLQTFWAKIKTWIASAVTTNSPSTSKTVTGFNDGKITYGNIKIAESQVTDLTTHLGEKAPIASPALTGTPTAPTAATGTDTTQIATTAFVNAEIASKMAQSDAMIYKGTLAGGSTGDYGALTPAADKGWTYKVTTAGKIDGVNVEVGDMLICNTDSTAAATASSYATVAANWDFIQGNQDGVVIGPASAVNNHVAVFDGTTGKLIKDGTYTIGKSVPSNAEFTDTKVTSVGNHYAPSEDSDSQLDADASGGTASWNTSVVSGVTIKRDAKGHVTGVSVDSVKIPSNPGDTKVAQRANNEDKEFPLLAKNTNNTTDETAGAKYKGGVTLNPNKAQITATKFVGALQGNADTATDLASGSVLSVGKGGTGKGSVTSNSYLKGNGTGALVERTYDEVRSDLGISAGANKVEASTTNGYIKIDGTDTKVYEHPDGSQTAAAAVKVGSNALGHVVLGDALVKGDVGLGNVDNTADASKEVLSATKLKTARNIDGVSFDGTAKIHHYGECSTAGGTAAKTVTLSDSMTFTLEAGASVFIKFTNSNSASNPTLAVNGTTAKSIYKYGSTVPGTSAATSWQAGSVVHLVYDGSAWQMVGWLNDNTTYSNASLGQGYGTCSTAEATAAKVVTLSNYSLTTGGIVAVKFTYGLCASATMNINSKGAKNIFIHGAAATSTTCKEVLAGDVAYFIYDGTQYQFLGTDRLFKAAIVSFADVGTAGTNATVQYTKADGTTGTLMTAITNSEIEALS